MSQIKLTLLDEDDLKLIETMLVRAGLRIFRQLAREGLLGQLAQPEKAPVSPAPPAAPREIPTSSWPVQPAMPPTPAPSAPEPLPSRPPPEEQDDSLEEVPVNDWQQEPTPARPPPVFLRPPPVSPFPTTKPVEAPPKPPEPPAKRKYRSVQQVCKTVADRPTGFIMTDEAYELIGGTSPSGALSQYVNNREVEALIVANVKPPTKGLPGRLMINKQSLLARLDLRAQNSKKFIRDRRVSTVAEA